MLSRKEFVEHGDWVCITNGSDQNRLVQAVEGKSFSCKEGNFLHVDLIGRRYGGKIYNMNNSNHLNIIHPTAYLWPAMVNYRTQILYQQDISLIQYYLDLKPGSVIIESGTGSGVLTTSLARSVAPHGHVHTFEFHPERVRKAREDFIQNKVSDVVTCRHRDILERGFPFFPQGVDAAFLDLPSPRDVIPSVDRSLRPQGRLCNFSPCIEQVQRVCLILAELGYEDIFTVEILSKDYELIKTTPPTSLTFNQSAVLSGIVSKMGLLPGAVANMYVLGQQTFVQEYEKRIAARAKERQDKNREAKKKIPAEKAEKESQENTNDPKTQVNDAVEAINDENNKDSVNTSTSTVINNPNDDEKAIKKAKNVAVENSNLVQLSPTLTTAPTTLEKILKTTKNDVKYQFTARPKKTMRGHTGYLTFARKRSNTTPQEGVEYATPFSKASFTEGK